MCVSEWLCVCVWVWKEVVIKSKNKLANSTPDCSEVDVNFKRTRNGFFFCALKPVAAKTLCTICFKCFYIISFVETVPLLNFFFLSDFFCWNVIPSYIFFLLLLLFFTLFFPFTWTVHALMLFCNSFVSKCCPFFSSFATGVLVVIVVSPFFFSYSAQISKAVIESFAKNFGHFFQQTTARCLVVRTGIIKQYFLFEIWARGSSFKCAFIYISASAFHLCSHTRWLWLFSLFLFVRACV